MDRTALSTSDVNQKRADQEGYDVLKARLTALEDRLGEIKKGYELRKIKNKTEVGKKLSMNDIKENLDASPAKNFKKKKLSIDPEN